MKNVVLASLLFVVTLTSACGGGSSSTEGFSTGLPKDQKVDLLSQGEVRQICERIQSRVQELDFTEEKACTFGALAFTSSPAECDEFVASCVSEPGTTTEEESQEDCAINEIQTASCPVVVAELEQCLGGLIEEIGNLFDSLSCSIAGNHGAAKPPAKSPDVKTIASCERIVNECPDLFNSDE